MKIISWNIRGLGRSEKKRTVTRLCLKEKLSMALIQESKLQKVHLRTIQFLSSKGSFQGAWVGSNGAVGGLVSLWDENFFSLESKVVNQRYILLVGTILLRNIRCGFGNITLLMMIEIDRCFGKNWKLF